MPKETWPPKCWACGKFISYADMEADLTIRRQPFGSYLDDEPPPEEWAHLRCER